MIRRIFIVAHPIHSKGPSCCSTLLLLGSRDGYCFKIKMIREWNVAMVPDDDVVNLVLSSTCSGCRDWSMRQCL